MSFPDITFEQAMELLTGGNICDLDNTTYDACCTIKYINERKHHFDFDKKDINGEYKRYIDYNGSGTMDMFSYFLGKY